MTVTANRRSEERSVFVTDLGTPSSASIVRKLRAEICPTRDMNTASSGYPSNYHEDLELADRPEAELHAEIVRLQQCMAGGDSLFGQSRIPQGFVLVKDFA